MLARSTNPLPMLLSSSNPSPWNGLGKQQRMAQGLAPVPMRPETADSGFRYQR